MSVLSDPFEDLIPAMMSGSVTLDMKESDDLESCGDTYSESVLQKPAKPESCRARKREVRGDELFQGDEGTDDSKAFSLSMISWPPILTAGTMDVTQVAAETKPGDCASDSDSEHKCDSDEDGVAKAIHSPPSYFDAVRMTFSSSSKVILSDSTPVLELEECHSPEYMAVGTTLGPAPVSSEACPLPCYSTLPVTSELNTEGEKTPLSFEVKTEEKTEMKTDVKKESVSKECELHKVLQSTVARSTEQVESAKQTQRAIEKECAQIQGAFEEIMNAKRALFGEILSTLKCAKQLVSSDTVLRAKQRLDEAKALSTRFAECRGDGTAEVLAAAELKAAEKRWESEKRDAAKGWTEHFEWVSRKPLSELMTLCLDDLRPAFGNWKQRMRISAGKAAATQPHGDDFCLDQLAELMDSKEPSVSLDSGQTLVAVSLAQRGTHHFAVEYPCASISCLRDEVWDKFAEHFADGGNSEDLVLSAIPYESDDDSSAELYDSNELDENLTFHLDSPFAKRPFAVRIVKPLAKPLDVQPPDSHPLDSHPPDSDPPDSDPLDTQPSLKFSLEPIQMDGYNSDDEKMEDVAISPFSTSAMAMMVSAEMTPSVSVSTFSHRDTVTQVVGVLPAFDLAQRSSLSMRSASHKPFPSVGDVSNIRVNVTFFHERMHKRQIDLPRVPRLSLSALKQMVFASFGWKLGDCNEDDMFVDADNGRDFIRIEDDRGLELAVDKLPRDGVLDVVLNERQGVKLPDIVGMKTVSIKSMPMPVSMPVLKTKTKSLPKSLSPPTSATSIEFDMDSIALPEDTATKSTGQPLEGVPPIQYALDVRNEKDPKAIGSKRVKLFAGMDFMEWRTQVMDAITIESDAKKRELMRVSVKVRESDGCVFEDCAVNSAAELHAFEEKYAQTEMKMVAFVSGDVPPAPCIKSVRCKSDGELDIILEPLSKEAITHPFYGRLQTDAKGSVPRMFRVSLTSARRPRIRIPHLDTTAMYHVSICTENEFGRSEWSASFGPVAADSSSHKAVAAMPAFSSKFMHIVLFGPPLRDLYSFGYKDFNDDVKVAADEFHVLLPFVCVNTAANVHVYALDKSQLKGDSDCVRFGISPFRFVSQKDGFVRRKTKAAIGLSAGSCVPPTTKISSWHVPKSETVFFIDFKQWNIIRGFGRKQKFYKVRAQVLFKHLMSRANTRTPASAFHFWTQYLKHCETLGVDMDQIRDEIQSLYVEGILKPMLKKKEINSEQLCDAIAMLTTYIVISNEDKEYPSSSELLQLFKLICGSKALGSAQNVVRQISSLDNGSVLVLIANALLARTTRIGAHGVDQIRLILWLNLLSLTTANTEAVASKLLSRKSWSVAAFSAHLLECVELDLHFSAVGKRPLPIEKLALHHLAAMSLEFAADVKFEQMEQIFKKLKDSSAFARAVCDSEADIILFFCENPLYIQPFAELAVARFHIEAGELQSSEEFCARLSAEERVAVRSVDKVICGYLRKGVRNEVTQNLLLYLTKYIAFVSVSTAEAFVETREFVTDGESFSWFEGHPFGFIDALRSRSRWRQLLYSLAAWYSCELTPSHLVPYFEAEGIHVVTALSSDEGPADAYGDTRGGP